MSGYHRATKRIASRLPYFSDCVGWPESLLPALNLLIDEGEEIERDELLAATEADEQAIPDWDYHVQYLRYGDDVYWYVNSAIEYVFAEPKSIQIVQDKAIESGY